MERLVNVTGEMNGESQGFRLLAGIARNTKDFDLLLEGIRDAAANVRAIFVKVCSRGPSRDIDAGSQTNCGVSHKISKVDQGPD